MERKATTSAQRIATTALALWLALAAIGSLPRLPQTDLTTTTTTETIR
jgi:hypothetical protein